jgi:hypothetical protein
MIRLHDFNTRWWGAPAGIVDDAHFFSLPSGEREKALAPYRWVEFKSGLAEAPPPPVLARAGFFLADTQIQFRIALKAGGGSSCEEGLTVQFADEVPFEMRDEDLAPFEHERFQHLPNQTGARITARYAEWGRLLVQEHPETCVEILSGGAIQGWFLSCPAEKGLNLTLAMAHQSARMSGFLLYERGLAAYAARGHRVGWASFSVTNTSVHNIYAKLGARFVAPLGIWLWVAESD